MRTHRPPARIAGVLALLLLASACAELETLTTTQALERLNVSSTKVYAADGTEIANLHGEINRDIVSLADIPQHVQDAVVAIEDRRFWTHRGVDLRAIGRAVATNVSGEEGQGIQGGSTLSQQLVKNLYFPEPSRTVERKLAEARLSLQFESQYSKEEILEMYLNTVYFGRGVYGIQTAAWSYFRKDASELTVGEAAYLAGLIHEPARYEWSDSDPPDRREARRSAALARRDLVLRAMVQTELLTPGEREAAAAEPLELAPRLETEWQYPYFVDMVLRELGVLRTGGNGELDPRFDFLGDTHAERSQSVYRGGLRIYTTVDPRAQAAAEEAVEDILPEDLEKISASLVAVEPGTGNVRAVVGGRDYYPADCPEGVGPEELSHACRLGKVNLALGEAGGGSGRQPGSAYKTVALAAALEAGISLRRTYSAQPFQHAYPGGVWRITNYGGSGGGHIDVVEATVRSVNAAYARLLIDGLGEGDALEGAARVADVSRRLGVDFPTEEDLREACGEDYGQTGACTPADAVPAITLGSKEVSPLQMAAAYATFANDGQYVAPSTIARITDNSGRVLYENRPASSEAIPQDVARGISYVLQQAVQRGTGTRARMSRPVAGKTGTSQMWRDAWFVGYTPQLAAAVWVGNPIPAQQRDGTWAVEAMTPSNGYPIRVTGGSYPTMIWRAFMTEALEGVPSRSFPRPSARFFSAQIPERTEEEREDTDETDEADEELEEEAERDRPFSRRDSEARASGTVPNVIGQSQAAARSELSRAGYDSATVRECDPQGRYGGLRVWQQSPGGGSSAAGGSTVTIWVNPAVCRDDG